MKRFVVFLGALVLLTSARSFAAGTVEVVSFYSNALGETRSMQVYLPEGYDPQGASDYPSLYFLHGANGSHLTYPEVITVLNQIIGAGDIQPVIVVKPDGRGGDFGGSNYVNSEYNGAFEDYIVFDVVDYVDSHYHTVDHRSRRGILGHSMGGFGATYLGLKHPEIFGALASHSGYPDLSRFEDQWIPLILAENGGTPPYTFHPGAGAYTALFYLFAQALSPNVANPPYFVDFPLDQSGDLISDVWARWMDDSPSVLAHSLPPTADLAIYFDCGMSDEYLFLPFNQSFDQVLTGLGIGHAFEPFAGWHYTYTQMVNRLRVSLSFLDDALTPLAGVDQPTTGMRDPGDLIQIASNPVSSEAVVSFFIPEDGPVSLRVFDAQGRSVAMLADQQLAEGCHQVKWRTDRLPAGTYYHRLRTPRVTAVERVIVMR